MIHIVPRLRALLIAVVAMAALVLAARPARAEFVPPAFSSSVVDQAGKLSEGERTYLTAKIERQRQATGYPMAVLIVASLQDESIDDVAYKTFQKWGIGSKPEDNGVLLVIAPTERKTRIETGKGVGGALTDLESNVILHERVGPLLKQERFRDGVEAGIDGIYQALAKDPRALQRDHATGKTNLKPIAIGVPIVIISFFLVPLIIAFVIFRAVVRAARNAGAGGPSRWRTGSSGPFIYYGGGSSGGSDWSGGGGSDSGSSGGGDWGGGSSSDYSGGGESGGGGSSDSY